MVDSDKMDDDQIAKTAVDSLMAIEIRGWVRRNMRLEISLAEITKAGNVEGLSIVVMQHLKAKRGSKSESGNSEVKDL